MGRQMAKKKFKVGDKVIGNEKKLASMGAKAR
jgi:hypothetical protein